MAADDDTLLDVFVAVRPDPEVLAATDKLIEDAVQRIKDKFLDAQRTIATQAAQISSTISSQRPPAPPRSPPGSPGAGGPTGPSQFQQDQEAARREVDDLIRNLRIIRKEMKDIGAATEIVEPLDDMLDRVRQLRIELRRIGTDQNQAGLDAVRNTGLPTFQREFSGIQSQASGQADLRRRFNEQVLLNAELKKEEVIRNRLLQSLTRGQPSADIRIAIAQQRAEVDKLQLAADRATRAFDGTEDSVRRLSLAITNVGEARERLNEIQTTAQQSGKSLNTLTNNAYQLGQAFEDAAVGFSLNGVTGAIRGASNNIAFLINNLAQVESIQKKFPDRWANQIPLIAGIGTAIALVLPYIIEWLESLNDIESSLKDVSKEIDQTFGDAEFEEGMRRQTREMQRFVDEAESVQDILSKLKESLTRSEDLGQGVLGQFSAFVTSGLAKKVNVGFQDLFSQIEVARAEVERRIAIVPTFLNNPAPGGVGLKQQSSEEIARLNEQLFGESSRKLQEQFEPLRKLREEVVKYQSAIAEASRKQALGIPAAPEISAATEALRKLQVEAKAVADTTLDFEDGFTDKLQKNIDSLLPQMERLNEESKELSRILDEDISRAIVGTVQRTSELKRVTELLRGEWAGLFSEQTQANDKIRQTIIKNEEELNRLLQFFRDANVDPGEIAIFEQNVETANQLERENTIIEQGIDLLEKKKDVEERIADIRKKSADLEKKNEKSVLTNFEAFVQKLQTTNLSTDTSREDAVKKNSEALYKAAEELAKLNFQLQQKRDLFFAGDDIQKIDEINRRRQFVGVEAPSFDKRNLPLDQLLGGQLTDAFTKFLQAQNNTTEAIKRKDMTARAN